VSQLIADKKLSGAGATYPALCTKHLPTVLLNALSVAPMAP
jgi:hypothetical protein